MIGGKKPKKGLFNGYAKLLIGRSGTEEKYSFGFRYKKCIKVSSEMISQISGKFVDDNIEGEVAVHFFDNTMLKGFAHLGHLFGPKRYFDIGNSNFLNITETESGDVYLKKYTQNGKSIALFGCHDTSEGKRCIVLTNGMSLSCVYITGQDLFKDGTNRTIFNVLKTHFLLTYCLF